MNLSQRIRHIELLITILVGIISLGVVRYPLMRRYEPIALDPPAAAEAYGFATEGDLPTTYFHELPPSLNYRTQLYLNKTNRGRVTDRIGTSLAYSTQDKERIYLDNNFNSIVGAVAGNGTGLYGLEYHYNDELLGRTNPFSAWYSALIHQPLQGNDLELTIDSRIQSAAAEALGEQTGAVVVLDVTTGAIYGAYSAPATGSRLATLSAVPPGSIFKSIVLAAALDTEHAKPDDIYEFGAAYTDEQGQYYAYNVNGVQIEDRNHLEDRLNLHDSFVVSANYTFAQLADEMDAQTLVTYAEKFGIGRNGTDKYPAMRLGTSPAQLVNDTENAVSILEDNQLLRAITGIGQGELLVSPLHMALVTASFINNGDAPQPYVINVIKNSNGQAFQPNRNGEWINNAVTKETANIVREMMIAVVEDEKGTGRLAAIPGAIVGGKTGTAETQPGLDPHAWFMGFVESETVDDTPLKLAIAVFVEHGGEGSQVAAPIFAQVGTASLSALGANLADTTVEAELLDPPNTTRLGTPIAYLTFDDGPNSLATNAILDLLRRYDAEATFFVVGNSAENHPDLIKKMRQAGHTVGNHTFNHLDVTELSAADLAAEIKDTDQVLQDTRTGLLDFGSDPLIFRPPWGIIDRRASNTIANLGYQVALWDIDTLDWEQPSNDSILQTVTDNIVPGSIILLHDGPDQVDRVQTILALELILQTLSNEGYVFRALK